MTKDHDIQSAARGYTQADREKDTISPAKQAASAASVRVESSRPLVDQMIATMKEAAELAEEVGAVDTHIELCKLIDDAKENRVRFF